MPPPYPPQAPPPEKDANVTIGAIDCGNGRVLLQVTGAKSGVQADGDWGGSAGSTGGFAVPTTRTVYAHLADDASTPVAHSYGGAAWAYVAADRIEANLPTGGWGGARIVDGWLQLKYGGAFRSAYQHVAETSASSCDGDAADAASFAGFEYQPPNASVTLMQCGASAARPLDSHHLLQVTGVWAGDTGGGGASAMTRTLYVDVGGGPIAASFEACVLGGDDDNGDGDGDDDDDDDGGGGNFSYCAAKCDADTSCTGTYQYTGAEWPYARYGDGVEASNVQNPTGVAVESFGGYLRVQQYLTWDSVSAAAVASATPSWFLAYQFAADVDVTDAYGVVTSTCSGDEEAGADGRPFHGVAHGVTQLSNGDATGYTLSLTTHDCGGGDVLVQVEGAWEGDTAGGWATARRRTLYLRTSDRNATLLASLGGKNTTLDHSYEGAAWPYVRGGAIGHVDAQLDGWLSPAITPLDESDASRGGYLELTDVVTGSRFYAYQRTNDDTGTCSGLSSAASGWRGVGGWMAPPPLGQFP